MSKSASVLAGLAVLPVFAFASVASAAVTYNSSLGGGNIYTAKNVTAGGTFGDPVNATCNDTLKLRVYIHNGGPLKAEGVKVKAVVPTAKSTSFGSTMVVSATNSDPASVTDTATIKTDKEANVKYVAGTGEYFDANGGRLGSISDTVVTTGADVPGGVDISIQQARYVQFQVKVECEAAPVTPVTPKAPEAPKTLSTQAPAVIAATGPTSAIVTMTGLSALTAGIGYAVQRRRNILG